MKELILIRHAKSDWGNEYLKDVDRHLSERGYRDAYFLSEWYAKNKTMPELILASTGTRALSTALIFARSLNFDMKNFKLEEKIYEASLETLVSVVKEQDKKNETLLLFGHNPGLTNFCNYLSDDLFFDEIPTCGIVSYQLPIKNWSELEPGKGKINFYQFPKDFKIKD